MWESTAKATEQKIKCENKTKNSGENIILTDVMLLFLNTEETTQKNKINRIVQ